MLNNIGLPGLVFLVVVIGLPIWLIVRSSKRKSRERERIASALEQLEKSKGDSGKSH